MNAPIDDSQDIISIDFTKEVLWRFLDLLNKNEIKDEGGAIIKLRFIELPDNKGLLEAHAFLPTPSLVAAR